MGIGVYGKHPAKGDFLSHGMPPAVQARLEVWLDAALAEARAALGPDWQAVWPSARPLHFWLGEGIWGQAVAGVMTPSQDRVGRRFPLVFLATGTDVPPPPVMAAGQDWHRALATHAAMVLARADLDQPADLLAGAPRPGLTLGATGGAVLQATRSGPEVGALWHDLAAADHRSAAATRSYWWTEGESAATLPDPVEVPLVAAPPALPDAPPPLDEADIWALAGVATDEEDSPFAGQAPGLFAAPAPAPALPVADLAAPEPARPAAPSTPAPRPAQVWAGAGLPAGAVLAWLFKGDATGGLQDAG